MIISEATYSILIPTQLLKEQNAKIYLLGIDHFMLKPKHMIQSALDLYTSLPYMV